MVDPDRLRAYNLTVTDVFNALRQQNLELPGGNLNAGAREFTVRTTGRVTDPAQFNQITVATRNGHVVKVSRHRVRRRQLRGTAHRRAPGWRSRRDIDRGQAKSGVNTVATADEVKQRLKEISASAAQGCSRAGDQRSVRIHQSRRR